MNKFLPVAVLFITILCGCQQASVQHVEDVEVSVLFCPRENCTSQLISVINQAQESINCAFFDLDQENVVEALASKSSGTNTKILIDQLNTQSNLNGPGIKYVKNEGLMHHKFCVIDHSTVITGSTNPTENGLHKNNNNLIVLQSETLSSNYQNEFDTLWQQTDPQTTRDTVVSSKNSTVVIENYFCPQDRCQDAILKTINTANTSIYAMIFAFTDEKVADLVLTKNVETVILADRTQAAGPYSQIPRLADFGITVTLDSNPRAMHHKVFIIDNTTVIAGSYNPTKAAHTRNNENILIIHNKNIAKQYSEEFWKLKS